MANLEAELRYAVLPALKDDADLTEVVARNDIYPKTVETDHGWPFVRYGASTAIPITGACVNGEDVAFTIHAFAKPRYGGGAKLEEAEDHADRIAGAIKGALHRMRITLPSGIVVSIRMSSKQVIQDGEEADAYHAILQFRAKVLAE